MLNSLTFVSRETKESHSALLPYYIYIYTLSNLLPPYSELPCIIHTVKPLVGTVMPTLRSVANMCSSMFICELR